MLKSTLLATSLLLATGQASAQDMVRRTILAADNSGTSTFLFEQVSADAAAKYVSEYISNLQPPHNLLMISVGDAGLSQRAISIRAQVTNRRASSPKKMAQQFAGFFANLPTMMRSGQLQADETTSLVAFFQSLEPICAEIPTRVILFSDAVEWSDVIDGRAFMRGDTELPVPTHPFLTGCHVEIHGVGQLKATMDSSGIEARLIPIWRDWLMAAGASSVRVHGSFFTF